MSYFFGLNCDHSIGLILNRAIEIIDLLLPFQIYDNMFYLHVHLTYSSIISAHVRRANVGGAKTGEPR